MKPLLLILAVLIVHISIGQENSSLHKWSVGVTTNLAIPGSATLALQPCTELQLKKRYSFVIGYSLKFIDIDKSKENITNQKYYRLLLEIRRRFIPNLKYASLYWGIQFTQSKRKFAIENGYFNEPGNDSTTYFTKANVKSPVATLSGQLGFNTSGKKKFFADIFTGIGLRVTNTQFSTIEGINRERRFLGKHYDWDSGLEVRGKSTFFHINAGVRLFYRIN